MDPQQRLLLEEGHAALHDAGYGRRSLLASEVGVLVGIQSNEFAHLVMRTPSFPVYATTGFTHSVASGRLSFVLGIQGPAYSVDSACSTALVAAHAAKGLAGSPQGNDALALAVNLVLLPISSVLLSTARMLSPDGRCKHLDTRANGYARAEAIGALLLRGYGHNVSPPPS